MGIIIVSITYVVSIIMLIMTRLELISRGRVFFKCLSSTLFICLWVISVFGKGLHYFDFIVLASLSFYMVGDILLVIIRTKKGFIIGMSVFMTGNIILITGLIFKTSLRVIDLVVLLLLIIIAAAGMGFKKLDFGGTGVIIAVYIFISCIMVAKAISVVWSASGSIIPLILFALGAFLYGVSDIVLANNKFKYRESKWLSPLNLGLYYSGIGLIAIFSTMIL